MSILVKAGTGLVAGVVAGGLGLAFFPRVEPATLNPRSAVVKPQFVASPSPAAFSAARAAPAVAVAAEAAEPAPEPKPALVVEKAATPAKAPEASPVAVAPVTLAKLEAPKPAAPSGDNKPVGFLAPSAAAPDFAKVAPLVAESRASAPATVTAPAPNAPNDAAAHWSVRGLVALAKGDLSSARIYLTRAAEAGDPRAFVALADTYDPAVLAKLGVVVAPGDAQRAKDYLIKAAAAGVVVPKDRMAALDPEARGN